MKKYNDYLKIISKIEKIRSKIRKLDEFIKAIIQIRSKKFSQNNEKD